MRLTDCTFQGTVIEGNDPKNRGRYRVVIPELMYNIYDKEEGFIYCSNQISGGRNSGSAKGIYGQYFPLHPNTRVSVKFASEDYSSAYINNVVSDFHDNSMPLVPGDESQRDNFTQLIRTVSNDLITVTNETSAGEVPANSMAFYHKGDNVKITFDPDGIHIYTKKYFDQQIDGKAYIGIDKDTEVLLKQNLKVSILLDNKVEITGNSDMTITGNNKIFIQGNNDLTVMGNNKIGIVGDNDYVVNGNNRVGVGNNNVIVNGTSKISVSQHNDITISGDSKVAIIGNCDLSFVGNCIINATGKCDINAASINFNCVATLTQSSLGVAQELIVNVEKLKKLEDLTDTTISTIEQMESLIGGLK